MAAHGAHDDGDGHHGGGHHDAHPHTVRDDKGAAFVGLIGGVVAIGAFLFAMVAWTNHHLAAEGGEKPAAAAGAAAAGAAAK